MLPVARLRANRARINAEMRALADKVAAARRDFTDEETAQHERMFAAQDTLRSQIESIERGTADVDENSPELRAVSRWLLNRRLDAEDVRALNATTDTDGGYLKLPGQAVAALLAAIDNLVFVRRRARVFSVNESGTLSAGGLDTDLGDFSWTTELASISEDAALRFGGRTLKSFPIAKLVKASKTLLRSPGISAEQVVRERIAAKVGITLEKHYLTGTGANQPLGVFTASDQGVSTSRDVSTGNTSTSITFDGLLESKFTLKSQYWPAASWLFHRDAIKQIAKLKDGAGRYLWNPSMRVGEPDMILGHPVEVSEHAPSTFTTGSYVGILGDFSHYWITDGLAVNVQRLVELYAESNVDGFIARYAGDGAPVLAEAFVRVKLG